MGGGNQTENDDLKETATVSNAEPVHSVENWQQADSEDIVLENDIEDSDLELDLDLEEIATASNAEPLAVTMILGSAGLYSGGEYDGLTITCDESSTVRKDEETGTILLEAGTGDGSFSLSGEWNGEVADGSPVVMVSGAADVFFEDLTIDASDTDVGSAFQIKTDNLPDVTIYLEGENVLKGGNFGAGIEKHGEDVKVGGDRVYVGTLEITGSGSLEAVGGQGAAGIGSISGYTRNILITGGTIRAVGGQGAAGIGGGDSDFASSSYITIEDGDIYAEGGESGAGIGGGHNNISSSKITINGGSVTAVGGKWAAGIGGGDGYYANGGRKGGWFDIFINGGTIAASGGKNASGIGDGYKNNFGDNLQISGADIRAVGDGGMSGIYSGSGSITNSIVVSIGVIAEGIDLGDDGTIDDSIVWSQRIEAGEAMPEHAAYEVIGSPLLDRDLTLDEGDTLTIARAESGDQNELTISGDSVVENHGTITNYDTIINHGTIVNYGTMVNNGTVINNGSIRNYGILEGDWSEVDGVQINTESGITLAMEPEAPVYGDMVTITVKVTQAESAYGLLRSASYGTMDFWQGEAGTGRLLNEAPVEVSRKDGYYYASFSFRLLGEEWTPQDTPYTLTAEFGGAGLLESSSKSMELMVGSLGDVTYLEKNGLTISCDAGGSIEYDEATGQFYLHNLVGSEVSFRVSGTWNGVMGEVDENDADSRDNGYGVLRLEENCHIYLEDVTIDASDLNKVNAIRCPANYSEKITIHLEGENVLKAGSWMCAILKKGAGNEKGCLEITGDGYLRAEGGWGAAAIGSNGDCAQNILISGGNIEAYGGRASAGIGGGNLAYGENITITGGHVTAVGGSGGGAGIGGGYEGNGVRIFIQGGDVTAVGTDASGIGAGGAHSARIPSGVEINISGGNIYAEGSGERAAIGGGYSGSNTITGGRVTAVGNGKNSGGIKGAAISGGVVSSIAYNTDPIAVERGRSVENCLLSAERIENGEPLPEQYSYKVIGSVVLEENFTLESGSSLEIPEGDSGYGETNNVLAVTEGVVFENYGTVTNGGTLENDGTIINYDVMENNGAVNNRGRIINYGSLLGDWSETGGDVADSRSAVLVSIEPENPVYGQEVTITAEISKEDSGNSLLRSAAVGTVDFRLDLGEAVIELNEEPIPVTEEGDGYTAALRIVLSGETWIPRADGFRVMADFGGAGSLLEGTGSVLFQVEKMAGAAAPELAAEDVENDVFVFYADDGFSYEYSMDGASAWEPVRAEWIGELNGRPVVTIPVEGRELLAGTLQVRAMESDIRAAGDCLENLSGYNMPLTGTVVIEKVGSSLDNGISGMGIVYGDILEAKTELSSGSEAALHYQWRADGESVGIDSPVYTAGDEAVSHAITVEVTAEAFRGSISSEATEPVGKAPRVMNTPAKEAATDTSITLTAAELPVGDGIVEYVLSENGELVQQEEGWQTGLTFTGLKRYTEYYFFARVTGSAVYEDAVSEACSVRTEKTKVKKPALGNDIYQYTSEMIEAELLGFDPELMAVMGNSGTEAGSYRVSVELKDPVGCEWEDGGTDAVYFDWEIQDEPGTDEPGTDEPGTDEPGTDEPGIDEPGTDNPGTDEPGIDEPGTDNPGTDEPGTDEPGTDKPGTDEPGTDEPGTVNPGTSKPGTGSGSSGGSGSGGSSSQSVRVDTKKGYVNSDGSIISGRGEGYSRWERVEQTKEDGSIQIQWKLRYMDGTYAAGKAISMENSDLEQPVWEKVDGAWYAFDASGYAQSGFVYDPNLNGWFYIDINTGMKTGWILVDGKWYYCNPISDGTQGMLLTGRKTPDGYYVDENGAWDGASAEEQE